MIWSLGSWGLYVSRISYISGSRKVIVLIYLWMFNWTRNTLACHIFSWLGVIKFISMELKQKNAIKNLIAAIYYNFVHVNLIGFKADRWVLSKLHSLTIHSVSCVWFDPIQVAIDSRVNSWVIVSRTSVTKAHDSDL